MRQVKLVKRHVEKSYEDAGVICDICGQKIPRSAYRCDEPTLAVGYGDCFPECDTRKFYELDVCGTCFSDKVDPMFLKQLGVRFREIDAEDRFDIETQVRENQVKILH